MSKCVREWLLGSTKESRPSTLAYALMLDNRRREDNGEKHSIPSRRTFEPLNLGRRDHLFISRKVLASDTRPNQLVHGPNPSEPLL